MKGSDFDPAARSASQLPRALRAFALAAPWLLFVALLLAIELAVRATLPDVSSLSLFVVSPLQQFGFTDRARVTIFEGDPLLFWRVRPHLDHVVWDFTVVSTNAQGLRHPGPVGPKRAGSRRIVTLGDSVTFGYRIPMVLPERPDEYDREALAYPGLLERDLRSANPGRDIEVINLSVPGYSSHQGLAWLQRDIEWLRPDLVVACFGWNDINERGASDREMLKTDAYHVALRRFATSSQIVSHAVSAWRARADQQPAPPEVHLRVPVADYLDNMLQIARLAAAHDAAAVVIAPVYRDASSIPQQAAHMTHHREALRGAMQQAAVPYLEIPELTESHHPENAPYFGELVHPNARGHRLIEQRLVELLAQRGMLWDLSPPRVTGNS